MYISGGPKKMTQNSDLFFFYNLQRICTIFFSLIYSDVIIQLSKFHVHTPCSFYIVSKIKTLVEKLNIIKWRQNVKLRQKHHAAPTAMSRWSESLRVWILQVETFFCYYDVIKQYQLNIWIKKMYAGRSRTKWNWIPSTKCSSPTDVIDRPSFLHGNSFFYGEVLFLFHSG